MPSVGQEAKNNESLWLEIKPASRNGHYVKPHECHQARQDTSQAINQRFDDFRHYLDKRLDTIERLLNK